MPIVAMPDGTRVRFPDEMPREEIQAIIRRKFPDANPEIGGTAYQFARGAVQGAIYDPVEGIGQIIEHASGLKIPIPQSVRNWFDKVRENTEATTAGKAGRVTGMVGSLLAAPEAIGAARAAGLGARAAGPARISAAEYRTALQNYANKVGTTPGNLTNAQRSEAIFGGGGPAATAPSRLARVGRQAAIGAAAGAAQPVEGDDDDFATRKAMQALAGGALGGVAGTRLGEVARYATRHHPWWTAGAVFHPASSVPTLATLAGLYALRGLERAGPRVAAPLGAAAGRTLSGTEETQDAATE